MIAKFLSRRSIGRATGFVVMITGLGLTSVALLATGPDWWTTRGVIVTTNAADDYAVANIGQLKHFAAKAADELNARLSNGAGSGINELIAEWGQPPPVGVLRDDYAILNQGQLKSVAKLFYDRLIAESIVAAYPWTSSISDDDSYAPVNIGQLKNVFAFGVIASDPWTQQYFPGQAVDPDADPDGDGLSNAQEQTNNSDPHDFYNGDAPVVVVVSGGDQVAAPGTYLTDPLVIRVIRANGTPIPNAPVVLDAMGESGGLSVETGTPNPSRTITLRSDAQGEARVFWQLPLE